MFDNNFVHAQFATPIYWERNFYTMSKEEEYFFDSLNKTKRDTSNTLLTDDLHVLRHPELEKVKNLIKSKIIDYLENVYHIDCEKIEIEITNSWGTVNLKNSCHDMHSHPHSIISCVYYITCDSGDFTFYQDKHSLQKDYRIDFDFKNHNIFNSTAWTVPVRTGDLLVFPSHLKHESHPNQSDTPKKLIGLNVWLRGEVGKHCRVNFLKI